MEQGVLPGLLIRSPWGPQLLGHQLEVMTSIIYLPVAGVSTMTPQLANIKTFSGSPGSELQQAFAKRQQ